MKLSGKDLAQLEVRMATLVYKNRGLQPPNTNNVLIPLFCQLFAC